MAQTAFLGPIVSLVVASRLEGGATRILGLSLQRPSVQLMSIVCRGKTGLWDAEWFGWYLGTRQELSSHQMTTPLHVLGQYTLARVISPEHWLLTSSAYWNCITRRAAPSNISHKPHSTLVNPHVFLTPFTRREYCKLPSYHYRHPLRSSLTSTLPSLKSSNSALAPAIPSPYLMQIHPCLHYNHFLRVKQYVQLQVFKDMHWRK